MNAILAPFPLAHPANCLTPRANASACIRIESYCISIVDVKYSIRCNRTMWVYAPRWNDFVNRPVLQCTLRAKISHKCINASGWMGKGTEPVSGTEAGCDFNFVSNVTAPCVAIAKCIHVFFNCSPKLPLLPIAKYTLGDTGSNSSRNHKRNIDCMWHDLTVAAGRVLMRAKWNV